MPYSLFPFMLDISGCEVLIIGGGLVASRRANTLIKCGAKITAISPKFCEKFPEEAQKICREFKISDIDSKFLFVIAATDDREVNKLVHDTAKEKAIPVNIADSQSECDFFFPSLINCENISVSVSSSGTSSKMTRKLSDKLRAVWESWVREEKTKLPEI